MATLGQTETCRIETLVVFDAVIVRDIVNPGSNLMSLCSNGNSDISYYIQ